MTNLDIKIALRTIYRNKVFSFINVIGLAIGISVAIVACLLVSYDFSFEGSQKDRNRIYRIVSQVGVEPNILYTPGVPMPLGDEVRTKIPGVESAAAFSIIFDPTVAIPANEDTHTFSRQKGVINAGPELFNVLEYKWLAGTPATSLEQPYQVVLTKSAIKQYFPGLQLNEIIGKSLIIRDSILTKVSGIVDDPAGNTDLTFRIFVSKATFQTARLRHPLYANWDVSIAPSQLFVKLSPDFKVASMRQQLEDIYRLHNINQNGSVLRPCPYQLQPLRDIHFDTRYGSFFDNRIANKPALYGLLFGAFFILILGCINFINLSTAQAEDRAKEIAVRKTLGSSRSQLASLFLTETFFMTLLAAILSLILVPLTLFILKDLVPAGVTFNPVRNPSILLYLLIVTIMVALLSGIYPSWVLSGYSPIHILKGKSDNNRGGSGIWLRKGLILTQFTISQAFIIGVVFVGIQLRYTLTKDLGFRKDAIVYFEVNSKDASLEKRLALFNKLKDIPEIANVSLSNGPASFNGSWTSLIKHSSSHGVIETSVQQKFADTNFLSLFRIPIIAGRNVRTYAPLKECIINIACSQALGYNDPKQAIGIMIKYDTVMIPVVGVISNFYEESLYEPIKPLMIAVDPRNQNIFNIALLRNKNNASTNEWRLSLEKVEKAYKDIYPQEDFIYDFQDETIEQYYKADIRLSLLLKYIAGLTIIVSSMGLLGFTIYLTNKRMKEISIRKILGASIFQIIQLFAFEFMTLIILAFVIAVPITFWFVNNWLNNFSYRISMSWWIFGLAGMIACLLALVTITLQTVRASVTKPLVFLNSD